MRIIISPAKKMIADSDTMAAEGMPVFLERTKQILSWMRGLSDAELLKLWGCNEKLAQLNRERICRMDPEKALTPALLSYEGIQYQYMAPRVFSQKQWDYVQEHLRILSGFYGILRPLDAVTPYRLEMQARLACGGAKNLYAFWGSSLYDELVKEDNEVLNLASKEYSKAVEPYVTDKIRFVTCVFGSLQNGKIKVKATEAKMARGEMVRRCAEENVQHIDEVKNFTVNGYSFAGELSGANEFVFLK